ncbi:MAG: hypothetical protein QOG54_1394 [Actinomycetota bacterium]|nr:hypothetical protein [Actinomycetota bacterium]
MDVASTVASVGARIRSLRSARERSLQSLAAETGLSVSMLSLVERGKASPSLGTLVAVASALNMSVGDLFEDSGQAQEEVVLSADEQAVLVMPDGVRRRIARADEKRGIELMIDEYEPGAGDDERDVHHSGFEYGVVLKGRLTVAVEGRVYELQQGDSIAYDSQSPHRIKNASRSSAVAVWVNLHRSDL